VLECVVEFVQPLIGVGVGIDLEFFNNRRSVVDVGGEFVEFAGSHEQLVVFRREQTSLFVRS
jgi:hypothetical protein